MRAADYVHRHATLVTWVLVAAALAYVGLLVAWAAGVVTAAAVVGLVEAAR